MAITSSAVVPSNSLEEFRIEFNNLVTDVEALEDISIVTATTTVEGKVELATNAETTTGTDAARVVTPAGLQAKVASATAKGIAELATTAETVTGTDTGRTVTPAGLHGALAGLTDTTIATGDSIIFADATDSNALKEDTVQGIIDLVTTDVVGDTSPQLGGDLDCNGAQIQWSKGADVASASALAVLTDGNYFDITGTTTVTSINTTGGAGTLIKLHFDDAVILTHHSTNLILAGAANFTTEAGDEVEFVEYDTGKYRMTGWSLAGTAPGGGGGGAFLGEGASGASVGDSGDIIRVNQQTLDTSQTMSATDNGSCAGPFSVASGVTLTINSGATFTVI